LANSERLVLGSIEAKFCKQILVGIAIYFEKKIKKKGKLLTRSTRFTRFCTFGIQLKNHEQRFWQAFAPLSIQNFSQISSNFFAFAFSQFYFQNFTDFFQKVV